MENARRVFKRTWGCVQTHADANGGRPTREQGAECPTRSYPAQSNELVRPTPQVDHIIFDTNAYQEGRPCVHVRTCNRQDTSSSVCEYGDWVEVRVLLWQDTDRALHVTTVQAVSKRGTNHPSASTRHSHRCLSPPLAERLTTRLPCGHSQFREEGRLGPGVGQERPVDTRRVVQFRTLRRTAQPLHAAPSSWRSARRRHGPYAAPVPVCRRLAVHAERAHAETATGTAHGACQGRGEGGRWCELPRRRDRPVGVPASGSVPMRPAVASTGQSGELWQSGACAGTARTFGCRRACAQD